MNETPRDGTPKPDPAPDQPHTMHNLIQGIHRIQERKEEELRRLCSLPDMFTVAQAITDEMLDTLHYLFNFDSAKANNGEPVDILEIVERIENDVKATFYKLTGQDYVPECVRRRKS